MAEKEKKPDNRKALDDVMMQLASKYWRLISTSIALGLALYLLSILGPVLGISVPTIYFMPTVYVIALAFVRDSSPDRIQTFTYAIFTGFIFFIIITFLTPYLSTFLSGG